MAFMLKWDNCQVSALSWSPNKNILCICNSRADFPFFADISKPLHLILSGGDPYSWVMGVGALCVGGFTWKFACAHMPI